MKEYVLLTIFLLSSVDFIFSEDIPYIYSKQIIEIQNELSEYFPREENSDNEKALFDYLENNFERVKSGYTVLDYSRLEKGHSFSRGYSVKINGKIDDLLVIAVPLNNKDYQNNINSGSVNIAIALKLLEIFSNFEPPVSVEFLFLGGERGDSKIYPIGSRYFLSNYAATIPTIVLYLDMDKAGDLITFRNSSHKDLSPMWLTESFAEIFIRENLDITTNSIQSLVFQSGFEIAPSIISTYLESEVPAIMLESGKSRDIKLSDDQWINSFIKSVLTFILNNEQGFDREWNRHYYISRIDGVLIMMGEKEGLLIIISLLAVLLFLLLFKSRNLHLNLKRFKNHFMTLPLLFFLTFLYLFLSTLIIEEISNMKDFPEMWTQFPILFLIFKLIAALFLYSGFQFLIKGLAISPSHHFYTYSAFVSVLINLFAVLIYNINFAYFFLWSLIIVSLFMITKKEFVKRIAIILSPLPLVIICYIIFKQPYLEICRFILKSRINGNIFLTIIIMPSLMLITSLNYYHHRFHRHRRSFSNIFSLIFWGSINLIILYNINNLSSYSSENKQPVIVDEIINLNEMSRSILLNSPAPIGDISLKLGEQELQLRNVKRSAEISAPMIPGLLNISETSSTFLDRKNLQYTFTAEGSPDKINIRLKSEKPMIIFDSNFPFEVTADGKTIDFYIGKNPDFPLQLNLIIPRGSKPDSVISLEYSDFPYEFKIDGELLNPQKKLSIVKNLQWEN